MRTTHGSCVSRKQQILSMISLTAPISVTFILSQPAGFQCFELARDGVGAFVSDGVDFSPTTVDLCKRKRMDVVLDRGVVAVGHNSVGLNVAGRGGVGR